MQSGLPQRLFRLLALLLLIGILGMIVWGSLYKQRWPADLHFIFVRWPFWVIVLVGLPLLAWRVATWQRRRRSSRRLASPPAH